MEKDHWIGIIILLAIISIALFGGVKNAGKILPNWNFNTQETSNPTNQGQVVADTGINSQYKNTVDLSYVNRSTDPSMEYVVIEQRAIIKLP